MSNFGGDVSSWSKLSQNFRISHTVGLPQNHSQQYQSFIKLTQIENLSFLDRNNLSKSSLCVIPNHTAPRRFVSKKIPQRKFSPIPARFHVFIRHSHAHPSDCHSTSPASLHINSLFIFTNQLLSSQSQIQRHNKIMENFPIFSESLILIEFFFPIDVDVKRERREN